MLEVGCHLGFGRHNKKFLANEAPFVAIVQIIQNRLIGFGDGFFDTVHFRFALKLTGLVEIAPTPRRGAIFRSPRQFGGKKSQVFK